MNISCAGLIQRRRRLTFCFTPPEGDSPLALVLSLSATIPARGVMAALPGARIAQLTFATPSYMMVKNRRVIDAFREAVQIHLSKLEAMSAAPISVFPALPAACAIEFGASLITQHQH
ncbi:SAVED domain-containing protein [Aeromonas hydrophila]|uniref:SAVED domain-containing protein n=1 Tax=Aeromonas hydrophila TaxID=644 RepID=UPI0038D12E36